MKRFATMRELSERIDATKRPGDLAHHATIDDTRRMARDGQLTGKVVMLDRALPYDPAEALVMMLVVTDSTHLVRVPLTQIEVKALIGFAEAEGR